MLKIRLTQAYAHRLAEKPMELANMVLVGIVLSQFLPDEAFSGSVALFGAIAFSGLHVGAYLLMKGGEQ